jgi:2-hydroxy-3-keto-5-methylthiopentenyl-1-phosphate phosphatase
MLTRCNSGFGHDKSLEIRPYARLPAEERPVLFYAGDGVSDLSAAKETDLLFAKSGRGKLRLPQSDAFILTRTDLVTYCENEKVPFQTFDDFSDIHNTIKNIVAGKLTVQEAATGRK